MKFFHQKKSDEKGLWKVEKHEKYNSGENYI